MTGPRDRERHVPTCLCGHNEQRHLVAGFDGECIADGCGCPGFDARVPLAPLVTTPRPIAAPNRLSRARTTLAAPLPAVPPLPAEGPRTYVAQPAVCEDCGETFRSGHAKGAHRRSKHPRAKAS